MIIVTGGAGFIGSNLVAGLAAAGKNDIVVCDVLGTDDKWRNLAKRELRDLIRPEELFDYLEEHKDSVEIIFHMGASSSTTEMDADFIMKNNFVLTRALWKWCAAHDTRFVYASSAATYGEGREGFKDDDSIEFLSHLRPMNPYGWSKHLFDRRVARITQDVSLTVPDAVPPQWAGLKFFNVYGPNEYHKEGQRSVVCHLYPQVIAGASARLFKSYRDDYRDGEQKRDFVWVGDCVDVMLWLYQNPNVSGLYNVGSGKARSFNDLAASVFRAANMPTKINYIDMPQGLQDRYQYFTEADMTKLRAAGYTKPMTELEEGVRIYVQDYLSKEDQYL